MTLSPTFSAGCLVLFLALSFKVFSASPPTALPERTQSREEIVRQLEQRIRERATAQMEKEKAAKDGKAPAAAQQQKRAGVPTALPTTPKAAKEAAPSQAPLIGSDDVVLYVDPPSATARVSEPLMSSVTAVCMKQNSMDKIDLRIAYDPEIFKPVSVHYHAIAEFVAADPVFEVKPATGQLRFSAELKESLRFASKPLLAIVWMPLRDSDHTVIDLNWPDQRSVLLSGDKDLLENPMLSRGSVVPCDVTVRPSTKDTLKKPYASTAESGTALLSHESVWLEMDGPLGPFAKDEEFTININLRNPNRAKFDTVSLLLRYPPDKAKVLDWDRGNWIRTGVNIHDGDHELFPYDFFFANEVNENAGRIYYRMSSTGRDLEAGGLIAQIRARALDPDVSSDDFQLVFSADSGPRTTEILLDGKPLLGNRAVPPQTE